MDNYTHPLGRKSATPGEMSEKMCIFEGGLYIKIPGGVKPKPMPPGDCQK